MRPNGARSQPERSAPYVRIGPGGSQAEVRPAGSVLWRKPEGRFGAEVIVSLGLKLEPHELAVQLDFAQLPIATHDEGLVALDRHGERGRGLVV